jgi:hypothetical protein
MGFKSGAVSKRARADLLLLALASLLVRGGERVGFAGMEGAPASSRLALTRIGRAMFGKAQGTLPPQVNFARGNQLVWFSDFLDEDVRTDEEIVAARGGRPSGACHRSRGRRFTYSGRTAGSPDGQDEEIFGRAEQIRTPIASASPRMANALRRRPPGWAGPAPRIAPTMRPRHH